MNAMPEVHLPESHVQSLQKIESGYWWFAGRVYWAKRLIREWWLNTPDEQPLRYADLGCGTGGFGFAIAREFEAARSGLFDGDPNVLNAIPKRPGMEVFPIDFSKKFHLPFRPNLVTCMDVIEHLEQDDEFLNQVHSQMEKKGLLLISVPAHQFLFSQWDTQLGHFRRYNKALLTKKLRKAGFEIVRSAYMWSFLTPIAPLRKMQKYDSASEINFPPVSKTVNQMLTLFSKMEWRLAKQLGTPFGTSLLMSAVKT